MQENIVVLFSKNFVLLQKKDTEIHLILESRHGRCLFEKPAIDTTYLQTTSI